METQLAIKDEGLLEKEIAANARTPVSYGDSKQIFLSQRERVMVDIFSKTQNYSLTAKVMVDTFKRSFSIQTIQRWMERPHVQGYLKELWEDMGAFEGWTKERYVRVVGEYAEVGKRPSHNQTPVFMKLLGQAKGFLNEAHSGINNNLQINFTQADGKE